MGAPLDVMYTPQLWGEKCFMADNSILHCWPQAAWSNPVCGWMSASKKSVTHCTFCRFGQKHNTAETKIVFCAHGQAVYSSVGSQVWFDVTSVFGFFFPLCKYFHFSSALKRECVKKGGNYSKSIAIVCSLYIFFFLPSRRNWGAKSAKLWFICQISSICLETRRENLLLQPYRCLRARFTMCSPAYVGYNVLWSVILYVLRLVWWVRKMMTGNQAG